MIIANVDMGMGVEGGIDVFCHPWWNLKGAVREVAVPDIGVNGLIIIV